MGNAALNINNISNKKMMLKLVVWKITTTLCIQLLRAFQNIFISKSFKFWFFTKICFEKYYSNKISHRYVFLSTRSRKWRLKHHEWYQVNWIFVKWIKYRVFQYDQRHYLDLYLNWTGTNLELNSCQIKSIFIQKYRTSGNFQFQLVFC